MQLVIRFNMPEACPYIEIREKDVCMARLIARRFVCTDTFCLYHNQF